MLDKFDMQIRNAELIDAVNTSEIVSNVISTHLVPDISRKSSEPMQDKTLDVLDVENHIVECHLIQTCHLWS